MTTNLVGTWKRLDRKQIEDSLDALGKDIDARMRLEYPNIVSRETLPMCAVCGVPVREITSMWDPRRGVQTFRVRCHGAEESTDIDWADTEPCTLKPGVAFATPKLTKGDR